MFEIHRLLFKRAVTCAALIGPTALVGCVGAPEPEEQSEGQKGRAFGHVEVALQLGDAIELRTVHFEIEGNGVHRSGDANVQRSGVLSFRVGGLPRGDGYVITLSAVDANDDAILCEGSSNFDIEAGETTQTTVSLECRLPRRRGSVRVSGELNVCPLIDDVSVLPDNVEVGGSIELLSLATDVDAQPSPLSYHWSSNGGEIADPTAASTTLLCTDPGVVTVTLSVGDGDCEDALTTTVTCTEPGEEEGEAILLWNEVESNGGLPDDWAELYNAGDASQDLSGWIFKDNDDTHSYAIPAGTSIAPGQYLVLENYGFGLGTPDSVRLFDPSMNLVASYSWGPHAPTSYGRCPDVSGEFGITTNPTKGAANDCTPTIVLNEVESSSGTPGDWVELYNGGLNTAELAGWTLKDNDDSHAYELPAGTSIAPGGYLVLEEANNGFGLGGADSARLFNAEGVLVDSFDWPSHASGAYGRCPDGSGPFSDLVSTKGSSNECPPDPDVAEEWPGDEEVLEVDPSGAYPADLSGLEYQPAAGSDASVLWAVINGEGRVHRLVQSGAQWLPTAGDWAAGKLLKYPSGTGRPDSEGLTKAEWDLPGLYISTERNNENNGVSRLSVLRVDETLADATLVASNEWNLTALLPVVGANLGLEAITWIPDAHLVDSGFVDANSAQAYDPAGYPDHGTGLFVVGVEGTGNLHFLALDHVTSAAQVVATVASGHVGVMSLEYDRDSELLWAGCDNTCGNQTTILEVVTGMFTPTARFLPPVELPQSNNEGLAIGSDAECSGGLKSVFWSDDSNASGHALRQGTVPCGNFF